MKSGWVGCWVGAWTN